MIFRVGRVAYKLNLDEELSQIDNTFHVLQLRNYVADDSVIVAMEDIQIDDFLNYIERPVAILDQKTKALCNKVVPFVKVQWHLRKGSKWTWEPNSEKRQHYRDLFKEADFEDEV